MASVPISDQEYRDLYRNQVAGHDFYEISSNPIASKGLQATQSVIVDTTGSRLRQLRKRHGLTQDELAERSGVTQQTVSGIEQDQQEPQGGTLRLLALGLKIPLKDFKDFLFQGKPIKTVIHPQSGNGDIDCEEIADKLMDGVAMMISHYSDGVQQRILADLSAKMTRAGPTPRTAGLGK